MVNTSGSFHAAIGGKKMKAKGKMTKLPKPNPKAKGQQQVPEMALSSYAKRRKAKMKGM
jgi:hypothetical protein